MVVLTLSEKCIKLLTYTVFRIIIIIIINPCVGNNDTSTICGSLVTYALFAWLKVLFADLL
jgi:hypothetical protein